MATQLLGLRGTSVPLAPAVSIPAPLTVSASMPCSIVGTFLQAHGVGAISAEVVFERSLWTLTVASETRFQWKGERQDPTVTKPRPGDPRENCRGFVLSPVAYQR